MKRQQISLKVGSIEAESCRSGRVGDTELAIFNVEGQVYVTQANCTHRGGPLCQGGLLGYIVTCPWHGSEFDIRTGEVITGPATEPLATYPVSQLDGNILIDVVETART